MDTRFERIRLGPSQCFLLSGAEGHVLVDTGTRGKEKTVVAFCASKEINPDDLRLIILTHGHHDHAGSANALSELTGAKIMIHAADESILSRGQTPPPKGINSWAKFLATMMRLIPSIGAFPTVNADNVIKTDISLEDFGINGRVLCTPGHTGGSVSVLLDTGEAFVGDLCMNGFPMRRGAGEPIFADDIPAVYDSWKKLIDAGALIIYPSHGKPFSADVLKDRLNELKRA
ncbi:MAG: MBL fold metallo-hydrolase [Thermoplasmata archaeon]|nr:MBL fold metallo-hydrolase [Thermoplasmata archaeon]